MKKRMLGLKSWRNNSGTKKDEGGLREFKACAEKVRTKLKETATDMYAHLHVFQQLATHIMDNIVLFKPRMSSLLPSRKD
jgi:hypothetical protein